MDVGPAQSYVQQVLLTCMVSATGGHGQPQLQLPPRILRARRGQPRRALAAHAPRAPTRMTRLVCASDS